MVLLRRCDVNNDDFMQIEKANERDNWDALFSCQSIRGIRGKTSTALSTKRM